jgi:hypothetical protein
MRQLLLLFALTLVSNCSISQIKDKRSGLSGDIKSDLKSLLPEGTYTVDIMDGVRQTPRQAALTLKFNNAIKSNYEWFLEYAKTIPDGKPMPYHENLGLTKAEYNELLVHFKNIEVVSTGTGNIQIEQKGDTIIFKSRGNLNNFNSLKIDTKSNVAVYGQYKMVVSDTLDVPEGNALGSKWKGYSWTFKVTANLDIDSIEDLSKVKLKEYELIIGRLEKNGKTYLSLSGKEIRNGTKPVDFELPVLF